METFHTYNTFVQVILPLSLPKLYTYAVPSVFENEIQVGKRVEVQFGKQKLYTAIIHSIINVSPVAYVPKEILAVVDEQPIITSTQLQFWQWMASYYMCTIGDVMQAALPAYFKLESETNFVQNLNTEIDILQLLDDEYLVVEAFHHQQELSLKDISDILQRKTISKTIKSLLEKRIIYVKETMYEKYTPKFEAFVSLIIKNNHKENTIKEAFKLVSKSEKQENLVLAYVELSKNKNVVKRKDLLKKANVTSDVLKSLIKKEIFIIEEQIVDRISDKAEVEVSNYCLSVEQSNTLINIKNQLEEKEVVLLQGITSSGKTLIYIDLIKEQLAKGNQVLFLLPEIALTAQLMLRLEKSLGNIAVYHSKYNNAERVEIWNKVLKNETKIVLGARSSVFLPFQKLGLIIVDEEHDASYKQNEPAPRYQCRDAAIYLATLNHAKVVLGSATPSIESYTNAQTGKYGLANLYHRFGNVQTPEITFVSLSEANKKKEIISGITFVLRDEIQQALNQKEQVILFQNRRGYAPYLACNQCNWIPQCMHCDVSLTYHKFTNDLRCHYCGYIQKTIRECSACGSHEIQQKGLGTERIEEDLKTMFPLANIGRMDYDTVKTKHGHDKLIEKFEDGDYDILVGTQMVTKGLDFSNVNLVGVLNADALLRYPDFRATERAYQLLTQVSGRAGRRAKRGKVIVQISNVQHAIVPFILEKSYHDFFNAQMQERKQFNYPPFTRIIKLTIKHKEQQNAIDASNKISDYLQVKYEGWIIGPNIPIIQKINNYYLRDVYIKVPKQFLALNQLKHDIQQAINGLYQFQSFKQIRVAIDVDCY